MDAPFAPKVPTIVLWQKCREAEQIICFGMTSWSSISPQIAHRKFLWQPVRNGAATAIEQDVVEAGTRLPSWQDLAARLGVARAVRAARQKPAAAQFIEGSRATDARVARRPLLGVATRPARKLARSCVRLFDVVRRFTYLPSALNEIEEAGSAASFACAVTKSGIRLADRLSAAFDRFVTPRRRGSTAASLGRRCGSQAGSNRAPE